MSKIVVIDPKHGLKDRGIKIRTALAILKVKAKAALLEYFFILDFKLSLF